MGLPSPSDNEENEFDFLATPLGKEILDILVTKTGKELARILGNYSIADFVETRCRLFNDELTEGFSSLDYLEGNIG